MKMMVMLGSITRGSFAIKQANFHPIEWCFEDQIFGQNNGTHWLNFMSFACSHYNYTKLLFSNFPVYSLFKNETFSYLENKKSYWISFCLSRKLVVIFSLRLGVAPSLNIQNWIESEISVIKPAVDVELFWDKAHEPQPQEIWLSTSPIGGTEPKCSKLNQALA